MRRLLCLVVTLMMGMPGIALAQSPDGPIVELGVQGSKRIRDEGVAGALRLTLPLTRRTAIEATADIQKSFELKWEGGTRRSARQFSVHWKQTVFTSGRLQIFGVLGAGRNRVEHNYPDRIVPGHVEPAHTNVQSEFVAHFGPAVQVELARWLALRGDLRHTLGERDPGVNVLVGAVIPIGRHRAADAPSVPAKPAQSTPLPDKWRRLKPGREVWVWVTPGTRSLVHGDIVAISDSSLTIREQGREVTIRLDDVRLVEGVDSKKNGFLIGAVPGAVVGGLVFFSAASSICGSCDIDEGAWIVPGAVAGGLVGGLIGMMVDGLNTGRQTLFGSGTTVVTPVITPTKKAIDVAIRWR